MKAPFTLLVGDALEQLRTLPDDSVQTCVSSPPYWGLRDYGVDGQIGMEGTPDKYVARLVEVFAEVLRVLRPDGTLWLNLGDSYAVGNGRSNDFDPKQPARRHGMRPANGKIGLRRKNLIGIPWRVAFALQAAGWYLRQDIIWAKPNPMPAPVVDRCVSAHEYVFLLSKSARYFFNIDAIKERAVSSKPSGNGFARAERIVTKGRGDDQPWDDVGGLRNARDVWTISSEPYAGTHFAVMPSELARRCVVASTRGGGARA